MVGLQTLSTFRLASFRVLYVEAKKKDGKGFFKSLYKETFMTVQELKIGIKYKF